MVPPLEGMYMMSVEGMMRQERTMGKNEVQTFKPLLTWSNSW